MMISNPTVLPATYKLGESEKWKGIDEGDDYYVGIIQLAGDDDDDHDHDDVNWWWSWS